MIKYDTFLLFLFALTSCLSDYTVIPRNTSLGVFTAKVNGKEWSRSYKYGYQVVQGLVRGGKSAFPCDTTPYYSLNTQLYTAEKFLRQELEIINIPLKLGTYKVTAYNRIANCISTDSVSALLISTIDDGCISGNSYRILDQKSNFVKIESYNAKTKEISGSFNFTFVVEMKNPEALLPDTMRFVDGKFRTKTMDLRRPTPSLPQANDTR